MELIVVLITASGKYFSISYLEFSDIVIRASAFFAEMRIYILNNSRFKGVCNLQEK